MPDIQILKTSAGGYVILAPRRAKRPDESEHFTAVCPFCIGNEKQEPEVFRMGGKEGDDNNWN